MASQTKMVEKLHSRDKWTIKKQNQKKEKTRFVPADRDFPDHKPYLTRLRKSSMYQCSYRRVSSSFPLNLQLLENIKILRDKCPPSSSFFFQSILADRSTVYTTYTMNTCSCFLVTFRCWLWRVHSLLLSFGGWIHTSGTLVVVGWSIVHIRAGSTNVHT